MLGRTAPPSLAMSAVECAACSEAPAVGGCVGSAYQHWLALGVWMQPPFPPAARSCSGSCTPD